jgi:protein-tyrosine-phosphatase
MAVNLLFVCKQNIIRSPAAHIIAEKFANYLGIEDLTIDSAGYYEPQYHDIADEIRCALNCGCISHTPKQADASLLEKQDLILWCTRKQEVMPIEGAKCIVDTLQGYAGHPNEEIIDPQGKILNSPYYVPLALAKPIYATIGKLDSRDYHGIKYHHTELVGSIRHYVLDSFKRMKQEGKIEFDSDRMKEAEKLWVPSKRHR